MGARCCGEEETYPPLPVDDDSLAESVDPTPLVSPTFVDFVVGTTDKGRLICERKRLDSRTGQLRPFGLVECDIDTPLRYQVTLVHQVPSSGTRQKPSKSIDLVPLTSAPTTP